ncbi:MAG: hypothetical protein BroJett011_00870 [Chloroflexota bacterium]|nr:MAG: hypothetical protein BroJett011_00870 [Chloroflexota bacterium]
MADPSSPVPSSSANQVLLAVRLGWLTVESFGRLRRYARSGYPLTGAPGDANRRFGFSDRSLTEQEELFFAVDQLHRTAARLKADLPPCPLPAQDKLAQLLAGQPELNAGQPELNACQGALDDWSRQVWTTLSTEDEKVGRGFTYGGSLADTYWHADILEPDHLAELLRPQRLEYLAARFDSIAEYLPPDVAPVLHYTLHKFRDQGQLARLDAEGKRRAFNRLESQAKVWHDLLFGSRSADSYLLTPDRRWLTLGALGITLVLVLAAMLGVWSFALTMSNAGRVVTAQMTGLPQEIGPAQSAIIGDVLDWQKWSTLLATLSSIVVLLAGLVSNVSGWILAVYRRLKEWLKLQFITYRTYRG